MRPVRSPPARSSGSRCWCVTAVPWYVSVPLLLVWAFLMLVSLAWWSGHPDRLPWVAVVAYLVWFGVVLGGSIAFNCG